MKLLVVTQKVDKDDENLGFFHGWLEEFARQAEEVRVIANSVGQHSLPTNVSIYSLGKENGKRRIGRYWKYWELFSHHYARTDAVFFHMIPEFVAVSSLFLLSLRHPSALWYVHKSITRILKWAERLVDWIFTASELSFRLPSKKVIYTGHAIDVERFKPILPEATTSRGGLKLLSLGRISPVKDLETVIRACEVLKNNWDRSWNLSVVGGPLMPRDTEYLESLQKLVKEKGLTNHVLFHGSVAHTSTPAVYNDHDIFISMSTTGSIDKSVLEAMASGLTVITANEAFQTLLPQVYFLEKRSPEFLAERIKSLADEVRPNEKLRGLVVEHHSLKKTIKSILDAYSKL